MSGELTSAAIASEARKIAQEIHNGENVGKIEASLVMAAAVRIEELIEDRTAQRSVNAAEITRLKAENERLRSHIQRVADTHEKMRVERHEMSLMPFDTAENKSIVIKRVEEQRLLRDIHLATIQEQPNG